MKIEQPINIAIVGGGVIGLTTGIILNLHGYKTKIYAEHLLTQIHPTKQSDRPRELASIHAAASIIPHSVDHPKATEMLDISQKFFHRLAFSATCGVRVQRHYELFEKPVDPPSYGGTLKDFTFLARDGKAYQHDPNIPHRKNAKGVWGWYFNTFFAEAPTYLQHLHELYIASGGMIITRRIENTDAFFDLDADVLVNCTGRWATEFFPEDAKHTKIVKGHMVKVQIHHVPHDPRDQYFSYNYCPASDVYYKLDKQNKKVSADVYFYPRSDGWLLGGSRLEGHPQIGEEWRDEDEQVAVEMIQKPEWEFAVPKPIWDLNRELIKGITHPTIDITDPKYPSYSYEGYRFVRTPIRIEKGKSKNNKILLHNYGHGGAGYTLSWGSAYEILALVEKETKRPAVFRTSTASRGLILALLSILEDLAKEELTKRNKKNNSA